MLERFELILLCTTNSGVIFPAIMEVPSALSEEDAIKKALAHLLQHGAAFSPMKGAPQIPVQVSSAVCVKVTPASMVMTARDTVKRLI